VSTEFNYFYNWSPLPPRPPYLFTSTNSLNATCFVFSPADTSISALAIFILSFYARLYIGGVLDLDPPLLDPSFVDCGVDDPELGFTFYAPMNCSSLAFKLGTDETRAKRSIFRMVFVGIFGVSFSKPPCIYTYESNYQTVCLNLWTQLNFFHSDVSVS